MSELHLNLTKFLVPFEFSKNLRLLIFLSDFHEEMLMGLTHHFLTLLSFTLMKYVETPLVKILLFATHDDNCK